MFKKTRKALLGAVVGAAALASTPASAGVMVFYYSDYVGGTPAGYQIICDSGSVHSYGNVWTGILIYHYQDVGC